MMRDTEAKVIITSKGSPRAAIVIDITDDDISREAANEIQTYIQKISGAVLPIRVAGSEIEPYLIILGGACKDYRLPEPELPRESFLIRTTDNKLQIIGADDDGLIFGVYTFLEKYCGVRWFWPGELGEIVPLNDSLTFTNLDYQSEPDFLWRDRGPGGPLWGNDDRKTKQRALGVSEKHMQEVALWERRNKLGGLQVGGGHEWSNIVPPARYGATHPEYFALVDGRRDRDFADFDGKHGAQLCTTNPDLIPVFTAYFREYFAQNPDVDVLHVTPNDGGGFCECHNCRALDTGKMLKKRPDKPVISERIFGFNNQLAAELQKIYPGKMLANMAYSWYVDPPENMRIDDHVIPQYCLWSCYLHWDDEKKESHYSIAKSWTEVAKNVGIYEYYQNGAWPDLPRIIYHKIAESLSYLHGIGIRLYQAQAGDGFAINGLNYYIASKLWWDIDADVEALVEEYYSAAFGLAGEYIRRYHSRLIDAWAEAVAGGAHPACSSFATSIVHQVYTLDLLDQCRTDLDNAHKAAENSIIQQRITFIEQGLRYTELTITAVTLTKALEERGITISKQNFTDEEEIVELSGSEQEEFLKDDHLKNDVAAALHAWEERDSFVETLKDDYVISYFWVKYNTVNRAFNPTRRLREIHEAVS